MQAFQLVEWRQPPVLRDVPVPEPGPGEVLIKVAGRGRAHSDLHLMEGAGGFSSCPFTLGHENAGWVEALGAGVTGGGRRSGCGLRPVGLRPLPRVPVSLENSVRERAPSRRGRGGLGLDGGMAEYMLVPYRAATGSPR